MELPKSPAPRVTGAGCSKFHCHIKASIEARCVEDRTGSGTGSEGSDHLAGSAVAAAALHTEGVVRHALRQDAAASLEASHSASIVASRSKGDRRVSFALRNNVNPSMKATSLLAYFTLRVSRIEPVCAIEQAIVCVRPVSYWMRHALRFCTSEWALRHRLRHALLRH